MKKKDIEKLLVEAYKIGQKSITCMRTIDAGKSEFPGDIRGAERAMLKILLQNSKK